MLLIYINTLQLTKLRYSLLQSTQHGILDILRLQHRRIPHSCEVKTLGDRLIPRVVDNLLRSQNRNR